MALDAFSGRGRETAKIQFLRDLKGGDGFHGIVMSEGTSYVRTSPPTIFQEHMYNLISGDRWKEQRRFALRQLRDFGLGRTSMKEIILDEYASLAEKLRKKSSQDVQCHLLFNVVVMNVLWRIVSGKRHDHSLRIYVLCM